MKETYCGKSCAQCAYKDEFSCPGCKGQHGASAECSIARCCRSSSRESCGSCFVNRHCSALASSDTMPQARIQQAIAKDRARPLEKLFWALFWVGAVSFAYGFVSDWLSYTGSGKVILVSKLLELLIALGCLVAYPVIFWKLGSQNDRYRKTAVCFIVSSLVYFVREQMDELLFFNIVLLGIVAAVEIYGIYNMYAAHASTVSPEDGSLEHKWHLLWKLHVGYFCLCGIFILSLFVLYPPTVKMLSFGLSAAEILKSIRTVLELVYLYQTAKAFQFCAYS